MPTLGAGRDRADDLRGQLKERKDGRERIKRRENRQEDRTDRKRDARRDDRNERHSHYHRHKVGVHVNVLPPRHTTIVVGGSPFYYYGGVYYRPTSSGYVIVAAPINASIVVLPFGYVAFNIGPSRYYYANGTYYVYSTTHRHYVVVAEPQGGAKAVAQASSSTPQILVYPKNGQNQEQQDQDRYECHVWAMEQSNFDPTSFEPQAVEHKSTYRRALTVCLEGRSYEVG